MLGYINKSVSPSIFPSILKLADITPVYKKDSQYEKNNYRPIGILLNLPKVFENVLYDQICSFLLTFSLNIKLVSAKLSSTNDKKFKEPLDQGGEYAALLKVSHQSMLKAFDCLPHDLILAKLHAHGFDLCIAI